MGDAIQFIERGAAKAPVATPCGLTPEMKSFVDNVIVPALVRKYSSDVESTKQKPASDCDLHMD